ALLLASLAIRDHDQRVCDPACGSGVLLSAAYDRKRQLRHACTEFSPIDHDRFVSRELLGIDIMPYAAHLAIIRLALKDLSSSTTSIQIKVADALLMEARGNEQDVVLMNPPFTKKQLLATKDGKNGFPDAYKSSLKDRFKPFFEKRILHGKSPFFAYFMCFADVLLGTPGTETKA
nr:N-6 DNA methylase [Candidatus Sigynarchaeota archaeon]